MARLSQHITLLIFFMTALIFIVTPVMAVVVQGTLQITEYVEGVQADNTATPPTPVTRGKWVITIEFNVPLNPKLKKESVYRYDGVGNRVFLGDEIIFEEIDSSTYTITRFGAEDGSNTPFFISMGPHGYLGEFSTTINNSRQGRTEITPDNPGSKIQLRIDPSYLPPYTYMIIGRHSLANNELASISVDTGLASNGQSVYPTLPQSAEVLNNSLAERTKMLIRRSPWSQPFIDVPTIPDLYAHFQEGQRGTIGVRVSDFVLRDIEEPNAKKLLITEVMWARDESQVGSPWQTREQWIEVYNNTTLPIQPSHITVSFESHPAGSPPPENKYTDMLSTYPSYTTVWDIDGKGQHGNSEVGNQREFISMARKDLTKDGWDPNNWEASTELFSPNYRGTPGRANYYTNLPGARTAPGKDAPRKSHIVINEIFNHGSNDDLDWIELKNISSGTVSLNEWLLSISTGFDSETEIIRFTGDNNESIPGGGVLLLAKTKPGHGMSPLSGGFDVNKGAIDQDFGIDKNVRYLIVPNLAIPNDENWLLILRHSKPWDKNVLKSGFKIEDIAGPGGPNDGDSGFGRHDLNDPNPNREKKSDGGSGGEIWNTKLFPLNGRTEKSDTFLQNELLTRNKAFQRNTGKNGFEKDAWAAAPFTGIGYKRNVTNVNAHTGTPGYDNGIARGKVGDISDGGLIISELMLTTDNGRYPQWIELTNTSKTQGIHLASDGSDPKTGWQIKFENHNSGTWASKNRDLTVTINLKDWFTYIPPQQSVLIAAFIGSFSGNIPDNRIVSVTATKRSDFKMEGRRDSFLNAEGGFWIQICDGDGNIADEVGNLDGVASNPRAGIGIDAPFGWDWPTEMTADDTRSSLIRIKNDDGTPRAGIPTRDAPDTADVDESDETGSVVPMGTLPGKRTATNAWVHASDLDFVDVVRSQETWFGASTDKGTPLYVPGQALPVSLSFFRPTLEDGEIVIRWTTESELDNAGFNILRSDSRDGEFTQVNEQMIQGKGTTGDRSTYKWVDTTAKPDAIYYYQIEDVSFAGERNTLATTKMKGLVSAKNKLTTTWSDLKLQN